MSKFALFLKTESKKITEGFYVLWLLKIFLILSAKIVVKSIFTIIYSYIVSWFTPAQVQSATNKFQAVLF